MTVRTDLETADGIHRRRFLRIDGYEFDLWEYGDQAIPTVAGGWSREGKVCLYAPTEMSMDLNLGTMMAGSGMITFELADIEDTDGNSYFGKLFAPGRWDNGDNDHVQITKGTAMYQNVDANASTIPVDDTTDFAASGTAYVGQETFTYTGKTGTSFTGVTKGKFPSVGSGTYGSTYHRPQSGGAGYQQTVGEVPFSWVGRRVAYYITTIDETTGTWQAEAQAEILWTGRIKDKMVLLGAGQGAYWQLSCEGITAEFDQNVFGNFGETYLKNINLQGDHGRSFQISVMNAFSAAPVSQANITVDKGVYTIDSLIKQVTKQLSDASNWTGVQRYFYLGKTNDGKVKLIIWTGATSGLVVFLNPRGLKNPGTGHASHVLKALGFELTKVTSQVTKAMNLNFPGGSTASGKGAEFTSGTYYEAYHPLHQGHNGAKLYVEKAEQLVADQGDDSSAVGHIQIEDCELDEDNKKDGTYVARYTALDTTNDVLTLGTDPDPQNVTGIGYVGQPYKKEKVKVQQVYIPTWKKTSTGVTAGPFEMLLRILMSTGTSAYNHATYDVLPIGWGIGIQSDLVDTQSFLDADKMIRQNPLSLRIVYVHAEAVSVADLIQRECQLFGFALVPRKGVLTLQDVVSPRLFNFDETLNDSNGASITETPDIEMSTNVVINQYKCEIKYDYTTGKYGPPIIITDVDSDQGLKVTKQISIKHPGVKVPVSAAGSVKALLENNLLQRFLRFPNGALKRSLIQTMVNRVFPGESIRLNTNDIMDPTGTGTRVTDVKCTCLAATWNHVNDVGECTVLMHDRVAGQGDPYTPAALVDKSAANGGWDDANDRLTLVAQQYGSGTDPDDGSAFELDDEVLIIERAASDPDAPTVYGPYAISKTYEEDGDELLNLPNGTTLSPAWDANKEWVVVFNDRGTLGLDQNLRGTWQAVVATGKFAAGTQGQRWG